MREKTSFHPDPSRRNSAVMICAVAGLVTAAVLYGQIPEVTQAPPRWEYDVLRVGPAFSQNQLTLLTDRVNDRAAQGWHYVGLLSLESTPSGYNGVVLLRRLKR